MKKISTASTLSKLSLLHNSPGPVNLQCYAQAAYSLNVAAETHTVYLSYKGAYGPAILPDKSLFKLTLAGCQRNQAVRKFYLRLHASSRLLC